jgi:hypothetical protein
MERPTARHNEGSFLTAQRAAAASASATSIAAAQTRPSRRCARRHAQLPFVLVGRRELRSSMSAMRQVDPESARSAVTTL